MTFFDHFTYITLKFAQYVYNKTDKYQVLVSLCQYVSETLIQKHNMGIIGNDMRIK